MAVGKPLLVDPATGRKPASEPAESSVPIVRLYGVTAEGHSVFAHVHGFTAYMYVPAPSNFEARHAEGLRLALCEAIRARGRGEEKNLKNPCLGVKIVKGKVRTQEHETWQHWCCKNLRTHCCC